MVTKKKIITLLRSNFDPIYLIAPDAMGKGESQIKCEMVAEILWAQILKDREERMRK